MKDKRKVVLILAAIVFVLGVLIKAYYIHYTPVWMRQHDVIGFGAEEGHAAYIEYILNNGALPDFDPRTKWAFFQPPLHHIISAGVLGVFLKLGINAGKAQENLQWLPFAYMLGVMIISVLLYRLFVAKQDDKNQDSKKDDFANSGLLIMVFVTAVHPIYTILSGSINNDALSLFLAAWALYFAVLWYENDSIGRIIPIAITIGLSMMAKLTGGLVAVPVGTLMIVKFVESIKQLRAEKNTDHENDGQYKNNPVVNTIIQYIIFAVIVAPLGLYFTIRNMVKWNMPVNYIPPVGEQFPADMTLSRRLFEIKLPSPYPLIEGSNSSFSDYNAIISLMKTSLFGEWDYSEVSGKLTYFSWALLFTAVILAILCLVATFYMTFNKKSGLCLEGRIVLFLTWITYLAAYLSFSLSYNNFSAEDFRYGAICIVMEGIFLGLYYNRISNKILKTVIFITSALFAGLSLFIYFIIGIKA